MARPGGSGSTNVWVRDEVSSSGEIALRDTAGEEYTRFEGADAVFKNVEVYPAEGETTVYRLIIPETYGGHPSLEVMSVPAPADEDIIRTCPPCYSAR